MKKLIIAVVFIFFASSLKGAEQIDLSIPYDPDDRTTSTMRISYIDMDWDGKLIDVCLVSTENNVKLYYQYEGEVAENLMKSLNKMDFSTDSLQKRVMERLVTDGILTGTVSGSPD